MTRRSFLHATATAMAAPFIQETQTGWLAGAASIKITPDRSIWMAGYAARTKPSEGVLADLHAKALALDDGTGRIAVIVTSDILGFPRSVSERIARSVQRKYRIPRDRLLLNSSHTHCGPVIGDSLRTAYLDLSPGDEAIITAYTAELERRVVEVVGRSIAAMRPATLRHTGTSAGFAINRRTRKPDGTYVISPNPDGPVDRNVPVLVVDGVDRKRIAVVFGYACHNTTLGADFYKLNGDYAGFAQQLIEERSPGAVALFVEGCAGDANPNPRGREEQARTYGRELGEAVAAASDGALHYVSGPLKCSFSIVRLPLAAPPSRDEWEKRTLDKDRYVQRHAKLMLSILDEQGELPRDYPYPVQTWQFGSDLTLVALGGEAVVDYDLRLKSEFGGDRVWVMGYSNDVMAYIPSLRVLREGGYEGGGSMIYYGQPGPWAESVEERILGRVRKMLGR